MWAILYPLTIRNGWCNDSDGSPARVREEREEDENDDSDDDDSWGKDDYGERMKNGE